MLPSLPLLMSPGMSPSNDFLTFLALENGNRDMKQRIGSQTKLSHRRKNHSGRRDSWGSQCSISEEFSGVQNISTLQKLHKLDVRLREASIHTNLWHGAVNL